MDSAQTVIRSSAIFNYQINSICWSAFGSAYNSFDLPKSTAFLYHDFRRSYNLKNILQYNLGLEILLTFLFLLNQNQWYVTNGYFFRLYLLQSFIWENIYIRATYLYLLFLLYLGFLSRTLTIHNTAVEGGGYQFNSFLPLPPSSKILRH